jgi:hypothetical protein
MRICTTLTPGIELPVVASDSPCNVAWLKNNPEPIGRLFILGESFNLELALLEAVNFPEVTKNMAQHGREVVERDVDWTEMFGVSIIYWPHIWFRD